MPASQWRRSDQRVKRGKLMAEKYSTEAWHAMGAGNTVDHLESDAGDGLTKEKAEERLRSHGENKLPEKKRELPVIRFLKHFNDILIYVLVGAMIVTFILGHYIDT